MLLTRPASAYCFTNGCSKDRPCTKMGDCPVNGLQLFWRTSCISFGVQKDGSGSDGIDYETTRSVIEQAFEAWLSADCGGGLPSISVENYGAITCDRREYNRDDGNANVFLFRDDDWPHTNALDTLALTHITYDTSTGEIYDVDVEINSFERTLTIDESNPVDDLPSIITHEVGHFFGLTHSQLGEATMREGYQTGSTDLRTLHSDDVAGMCALYPPNRELPAAECEPRHGFSSDCGERESGCCAVQPTRPRKSGQLAWLLAGVGLVVWRRRARGRRRHDAGRCAEEIQ